MGTAGNQAFPQIWTWREAAGVAAEAREASQQLDQTQTAVATAMSQSFITRLESTAAGGSGDDDQPLG